MSKKTSISGHFTLLPRVVHAFTSMARVRSQRKRTSVLRVTRSCFLPGMGGEGDGNSDSAFGNGNGEGGKEGGVKGTEVGMERHAGGGEGPTPREQGWLTDACRGRLGKVDRKEGAMGRGYFCDGMPGWTYFSQPTPGHPASFIYKMALNDCMDIHMSEKA